MCFESEKLFNKMYLVSKWYLFIYLVKVFKTCLFDMGQIDTVLCLFPKCWQLCNHGWKSAGTNCVWIKNASLFIFIK